MLHRPRPEAATLHALAGTCLPQTWKGRFFIPEQELAGALPKAWVKRFIVKRSERYNLVPYKGREYDYPPCPDGVHTAVCVSSRVTYREVVPNRLEVPIRIGLLVMTHQLKPWVCADGLWRVPIPNPYWWDTKVAVRGDVLLLRFKHEALWDPIMEPAVMTREELTP